MSGNNNNVNVSKKKTEVKIDIAICPNCSFHFKYTPIVSDKTIAQQRTNMTQYQLRQYKALAKQEWKVQRLSGKQLQNSRTMKTLQDSLIKEIKNKSIEKLEKLKKLNDLYSLKNSRLTDSRYESIPQQIENNSISYTNLKENFIQTSVKPKIEIQQRESFAEHQQSRLIIEKYSGIASNPSQNLIKTQTVIKQKQSIIKQIRAKNEMQNLIKYLLQWIQSFTKINELPHIIKSLIKDYNTKYPLIKS